MTTQRQHRDGKGEERLFKQEQERVDRFYAANDHNGREQIVLKAPQASIGAELGVDTGQLSRRFLELDHLALLHSVDKWDDHAHSERQYKAVVERLKNYPRSKVWRCTAQDWLARMPDQSLGFIYVDCYAHTGQDDGSILEAAWPKLRDGGLFAGDDYDQKHWPKTFAAVNNFAGSVGKQVLVSADFCKSATISVDRHPTWYFTK